MLGILSWWLVVQLFSAAALPLIWRFFRFLPSRGYPLAKAAGLLLVSYCLWVGASFRLLPNSVGGVLFALGIVFASSWWVGRDGLRKTGQDGLRPLAAWLRDNRRLILAVEVLFLAVLAGWAAFRAYNPDIAGTEKPMELAFLNGVLNSRFFPPQDPWLSGYGISYYYFGYVMLAVLSRLSGVDPFASFNLGVALWCSLGAVGAFGVVYDLVRIGSASLQGASTVGRAIRYGLLGSLFVAFLGNLEGIVELAYNRQLVPMSWIKWLDIKQLMDSPPTGNLTGGFWWWWHASRVIHDKDLLGNSVEVIDEFPFFSYLLGDMHPHVLGLPFVLLAIGAALNLMFAARHMAADDASGVEGASGTTRRLLSRAARFLGGLTGEGPAGLLLYAVVLGGLAFLNTWDFPIYLGLTALAVGAGIALRSGLSWGALGKAAAAGVVLGLLGWLCYLPFYLGFQSQLGGILPNLLFPSRFSQFFLVFGTFLVVVVFYLLLLSRSRSPAGQAPPGIASRSLSRRFLAVLPWAILLPLGLWIVLGLLIAILPQGRSFVQSLLNDPAVQANVATRTVPQLAALVLRIRLGSPWVYAALAILVSWVLSLAWVRLSGNLRGGGVDLDPQHDARSSIDTFALLMIAAALVLALSVEFMYLRDLFGTRMNTVFKFYYQAWILLALASAYALSRLVARATPGLLRWPAIVATTVLVAGGLFYTVAAIPSKADNFQGQPTLDGLAYLRRSDPADAAAIEWIRAHVPTTSVVLEAAGGSYSPEGAERVSMSTGNPTLLGWDFHEMQWRGNAYQELVAGRPEALTEIYRTAPAGDLRGLLEKWGIDYVYVGALERNKYKINDAALSRFDAVLSRVYDSDGVIIYSR